MLCFQCNMDEIAIQGYPHEGHGFQKVVFKYEIIPDHVNNMGKGDFKRNTHKVQVDIRTIKEYYPNKNLSEYYIQDLNFF